MDNRQPLVSVATPFFNPAPYFVQCIESVLGQTYGNFEYVLLDNCSTDGSFELAEDYARRDKRVKVLRNPQPISGTQNHNAVLRQISPQAKYCKVLQADDWLFPTCLAEMVRVAEAHPSIGIVSAYTLLERAVYLTGLPYPSEFIAGPEICRRALLQGMNVFGSPTASLIRADLVRGRDPFYDERSPMDDLDVCLELLEHSDFGFINQVLSFTRRENVSTITTMKTFGLSALTDIMTVYRYGPRYIPAAELEQRKKQVERDEYRLLARGWVLRRPQQFWDFHRDGLALAGLTISKPKLARYIIGVLLDKLLNPKETVERLLARRRRTR